MKVTHIHKITGVSGSERHLLALLPALRERGVDARFLGLNVAGTDAPRFYRELRDVGVPFEHVRCTLDANPRMAADVSGRYGGSVPISSTRTSSTATSTARSRPAVSRVPFVSTRHNDDRYLMGAVPPRRPASSRAAPAGSSPSPTPS